MELVFGIVPTNLFDPFVTGNALQIIFIAIMIGLAMLTLSTRVNGIFSMVEQVTAIIQTIMAGLSSMMPILIFTLFTGMITNLLVAFAVPPIPGGMMMGFTIVFTQLGLPLELMGIALAISTITDFPGTALNVSSWQLGLIDVADSLDMLDHDVLRSE